MVFFIYATIQFKNKNKSTIPKTIYALHPTEILTKRLHSIKVKLLNLHIGILVYLLKKIRRRSKLLFPFLATQTERFYRCFMNAFEYCM